LIRGTAVRIAHSSAARPTGHKKALPFRERGVSENMLDLVQITIHLGGETARDPAEITAYKADFE
jgi:hypothetical protein